MKRLDAKVKKMTLDEITENVAKIEKARQRLADMEAKVEAAIQENEEAVRRSKDAELAQLDQIRKKLRSGASASENVATEPSSKTAQVEPQKPSSVKGEISQKSTSQARENKSQKAEVVSNAGSNTVKEQEAKPESAKPEHEEEPVFDSEPDFTATANKPSQQKSKKPTVQSKAETPDNEDEVDIDELDPFDDLDPEALPF